MEDYNSYKNYKSIVDAKITEEEMYKIFTRFPAFSNYTIQSYNSVVTWQAMKYQHLCRLYVYRKNKEAARFFRMNYRMV